MCLIEMQCNLIGPSFVENYMEIYEFDRLYVICFYSSKDASKNSREVIFSIKFFICKISHIWNLAVSKYLIFFNGQKLGFYFLGYSGPILIPKKIKRLIGHKKNFC
jgi:hypothetical protein